MIAITPKMVIRGWWIARLWRRWLDAWEERLNPGVRARREEVTRLMLFVDRLFP